MKNTIKTHTMKNCLQTTGYFTLFTGKDCQYYFNLKAGNHEIILQSEGYTTKANALNGIRSVQENCSIDSQFERKKSTRDSPFFVLKAGNGEIIGRGEEYSSSSMMEVGISSVKNNGISSVIKEDLDASCFDNYDFEIIVNGRVKQFKGEQISYLQVVKLAFPDCEVTANTIFTVSYSKGTETKPQGTLVGGQSVNVKSKMIFNVTRTDKS